MSSLYQVDWLGGTRYVTDITGNGVLAAQSYDAWGHRDAQATGSPNHPTDMQFAGGWGYQTEWSNGAQEPGLGLDYLQQRYYDPVVGRFIAPDPLGFGGGLNLYEYAGNDPANGIDPLGLDGEANPGSNSTNPQAAEGDGDPARVMNEPGTAPVVEPEPPAEPEELAAMAGKIVEGSGVIRFDASIYRALGMPPPINMMSPRGPTSFQTLIGGLPDEFRAEFRTISSDLVDWGPVNMNAWAWVRTPAENARCQRDAARPGHHRHPVSLGGAARPAEGLLQTGDTRTRINRNHTTVTDFWYRVWRFLGGGTR